MRRAPRGYKDYFKNLRERSGKRFFLTLKVAGNESSAWWFAIEPALVGQSQTPRLTLIHAPSYPLDRRNDRFIPKAATFGRERYGDRYARTLLAR